MKKLKLKLKKLKTQEFFAQNSKFRQFFQKLKKIFNQIVQFFYLKSGKIVQKLKNLPQTQGKISKNLKFPANSPTPKDKKRPKIKPELGKTQISEHQHLFWQEELFIFP